MGNLRWFGVMLAFAGGATWAAASWVISAQGVGPVRIGGPLAEAVVSMRAIATPREVVRQMEGEAYRAVELWRENTLLMTVEPEGDTIWRIDIRAPEFRSADGLGVGSTLADIQKRYPKFRFFPGEGITCGTPAPKGGYSLCFTQPAPRTKDTVSRVLIFGSD